VTWSASSNKSTNPLDSISRATWSNVGGDGTDDVGQLTFTTNLVDPSILDRFYRVLLSQ